MPDIDTSIYAHAAPPVFDPLATVGKAQALGLGMLQNRLLAQEVEGKIARGQAAQAAITPGGEFDPNQFMMNLKSGGPRAAQFAPEAATLAQQQRQAQIAAAQAQLGLNASELSVVGATVLPLIQKYSTPDPKTGQTPTIDRDEVVRAITDNVAAAGGDVSPNLVSRAATFIDHLPKDPAKIMEQLQSLALISSPTPDRIAQVFGSVDKTDTGPAVALTQTPTLGGPTTVRTVLDKGLSPSEENTPSYTYTDADGVQHIVTKREAADAAARGVAPKGISSGVPLGASEEAASGVQMANGWRKAAEVAPETKANIQNLRDQIGKFTSGPQATWVYRMKALATMAGVAPKDVKDEVAAQEEFAKISQQLVNQNTAVLGQGTDAKLGASLKANPNEFLSQQGATGVLAILEGQEDAKLAKNAAWQKWRDAGNGPGTAGKFQTQWNQIYDPRVFQSQYMSDPQRQNMLKNMTPKERETFQSQWVNAKKFGWIK